MGETNTFLRLPTFDVAFSILKRIVMGETPFPPRLPESSAAFSILKRIVMGETLMLFTRPPETGYSTFAVAT